MRFDQNKGKFNNCDIRYTIKKKCYIDNTFELRVENKEKPFFNFDILLISLYCCMDLLFWIHP